MLSLKLIIFAYVAAVVALLVVPILVAKGWSKGLWGLALLTGLVLMAGSSKGPAKAPWITTGITAALAPAVSVARRRPPVPEAQDDPPPPKGRLARANRRNR